MVTDLVVLGRADARYFVCDHPWACISIADAPGEFVRIRRWNRVGLLRLAFADLEQPRAGYAVFDDDLAHDVLDFVTHHWDRARTLMVHCVAGRSRSPAVAAALSRLKFDTEGEFSDDPYFPNPRVYRILREVASGRGDYQDG